MVYLSLNCRPFDNSTISEFSRSSPNFRDVLLYFIAETSNTQREKVILEHTSSLAIAVGSFIAVFAMIGAIFFVWKCGFR